MGLIDESDAKENWTPYVVPFPEWMMELSDGEHIVNGHEFSMTTYEGARTVSYKKTLSGSKVGTGLFFGRWSRPYVEPKSWGKEGRVMDDTETLQVVRDAVKANAVNWRNMLDERQRKEVAWAEKYVSEFNHGTVGHNQLQVIAKLAGLLDEIEKGVSG